MKTLTNLLTPKMRSTSNATINTFARNKDKNENKNQSKLKITILCLSTVALGATAITAPTAGSFAYDIYDVGVNEILKGAPGFVGGMLGIIFSATKLSTDWKMASLGVLASTAVIKADSITTSLGLVI